MKIKIINTKHTAKMKAPMERVSGKRRKQTMSLIENRNRYGISPSLWHSFIPFIRSFICERMAILFLLLPLFHLLRLKNGIYSISKQNPMNNELKYFLILFVNSFFLCVYVFHEWVEQHNHTKERNKERKNNSNRILAALWEISSIIIH